jgi:hypothetical protein
MNIQPILSALDVSFAPKATVAEATALISSSRRAAANPFDASLHVHASDMLALSLLQARLIDLRLPIKVER